MRIFLLVVAGGVSAFQSQAQFCREYWRAEIKEPIFEAFEVNTASGTVHHVSCGVIRDGKRTP